MNKISITVMLCGLFTTQSALAATNQVTVPQTTAILTVDNPSEVIQIKNRQQSVAYVQSHVVEVFIDKDGNESFDAIDGIKKANAVVALPEKFIISPMGVFKR